MWRAQSAALDGEGFAGRQRLGDAAIGEDRASRAFFDQNVIGLDVTMHHSDAMSVFKSVSQFDENAAARFHIESTFATQLFRERLMPITISSVVKGSERSASGAKGSRNRATAGFDQNAEGAVDVCTRSPSISAS